MPAPTLEVVKAAGQVPSHPEADQFRTLEGVGGDGVTDLGIELLSALSLLSLRKSRSSVMAQGLSHGCDKTSG
jgi:hypothetical protein